MLTGQFKTHADVQHLGPIISSFPRFSDENLAHNLKLVEKVNALAQKKGCTSGQLAIAWVRHVATRPGMPDIIPTPGSISVSRVEENSKAVDLTEDEAGELNHLIDNFTVAGLRYPKVVPIEL